MRFYNKLLLNLTGAAFLLILFYYCFVTDSSTINDKYVRYKNDHSKTANVSTSINNSVFKETINVWCIYTKVIENAPLQVKFQNLLRSLFMHSSVPLHIHVISDNSSKIIAQKVLEDARNFSRENISSSFYDVVHCAQMINDIVQVMMPHFSSQPGTYYSDALFYLSLGLHRIADKNQTKAVMLDCDVQFTKDILLLYKEFDRFQSTNLFGLGYELTPVYRHVLYSYRSHRNTTFGEYSHKKKLKTNENHPYGFPGYNSGVILFNLSAIRQSKTYPEIISKENVDRLTLKYKFKGHLGDQDLYTILGYEYPEMFNTLPCYFNRQLCVWWRDHGYSDVFANYSKCEGEIIIYHGNCNTPIPVK